jgi:uncharacterized protein (TIGR03435 family)
VGAIPHLNELAEEFADKPVRFIAITDEDEAVIRPFLKKRPMRAWVGLDNNKETFKSYGVSLIPHTVLVDRDGQIVAETRPAAVTASVLNDLLADRSPSLPTRQRGRRITPGVAPDGDADADDPPLLQVVIRAAGDEPGATARSMGRMTAKSIDLRSALSVAHSIRPSRIQLSPDLPKDKFLIVISVPDEQSEMFEPVLQTALAATVGLSATRSSREMDVLMLEAPLGVSGGLQPAVADAGSMSQTGTHHVSVTGAGLDTLGAWLEQLLDTPVVDNTGLDGRYDYEFRTETDDLEQVGDALRAQLGLELRAGRRAVDVLVVEPRGDDGS